MGIPSECIWLSIWVISSKWFKGSQYLGLSIIIPIFFGSIGTIITS